jgi:hypothetical protein
MKRRWKSNLTPIRPIEARKKIAAAGIPPITMEEIQAEIDADRAERRTKAAG